MQQCLLLGKVVTGAGLMPNFSNVLVFGTDNLVWLIEKGSISNNLEQELVRSCNLPIRKKSTKRAPRWIHFCRWFDNLKWSFKIQQCLLLNKVVKRPYIFRNFSNILIFWTDNLVELSEKSNISNNFEQELVRSCNLPISKRTAKRPLTWISFCLWVDTF